MSVMDIKQLSQKLRILLDSGGLPDNVATRAETLFSKLTQPVCVAAVGKANSGKTTVLNALFGETLVPDISGPAFSRIEFHERARYAIVSDYSNSDWVDGHISNADVSLGGSRVIQQLPSEVLSRKCAVEITLPDTPDQQSECLSQIQQNADIVLWCTRQFDDAEATFWSSVPDLLKDHSFLVLTHADALQAAGALTHWNTRFQSDLAEEFMCLFPVAAKHARHAHFDGDIQDPKLWQASGGQALAEAIENEIRLALQAYIDHAEVIVDRYQNFVSDASTPQTTQHIPNRNSQTETELSPMKRNEAFATALTVLQSPVNEMLENVQDGQPDAGSVLDHTAQAAQALATLFMDANTNDAALNTFRETILEYEQMALLLQNEGTTEAACDAVTALLQLKKEISEVAYA